VSCIVLLDCIFKVFNIDVQPEVKHHHHHARWQVGLYRKKLSSSLSLTDSYYTCVPTASMANRVVTNTSTSSAPTSSAVCTYSKSTTTVASKSFPLPASSMSKTGGLSSVPVSGSFVVNSSSLPSVSCVPLPITSSLTTASATAGNTWHKSLLMAGRKASSLWKYFSSNLQRFSFEIS